MKKNENLFGILDEILMQAIGRILQSLSKTSGGVYANSKDIYPKGDSGERPPLKGEYKICYLVHKNYLCETFPNS